MTFLNDKKNFDIILKALPISSIKKSYSKLFNIEQIGREKTAEGKPIFRIKPIDKRTFLQYFLDGKKSTILERQKQLAREIITPIVKETVADYATIENLADLESIRSLAPEDSIDVINNVIVSAKLNEIESQLDRYKNEDKSFDEIQFSFSGLEKKEIYEQSRKVALDEQHLASQEFLSLPEKIQTFIKNVAKAEIFKGKTFGGLIYES